MFCSFISSFIKKHAAPLSLVMRVFGLGTAGVMLIVYFGDVQLSLPKIYSLGVISATVLMVTSLLTIPMANYLAKALRLVGRQSVIQLSEADCVLEANAQKRTAMAFGKYALGLLGSIGIGLLTSYIGKFVGL